MDSFFQDASERQSLLLKAISTSQLGHMEVQLTPSRGLAVLS
jgi:hypothetical protein